MLKKLLIGIVAIPVLLIIALVIFINTIDASRVKPLLSQKIAEQGYEVDFIGDIRWSLYPHIGLKLGQLRAKVLNEQTQNADVFLAEINEVELAVKLVPLLRKKIEVHTVALIGGHFNLHVDKNGKDNWSSRVAPTASSPIKTEENEPDEDTPQSTAPDIEIKEVRISNTTLNYSDETSATKIKVGQTQLGIHNVNTQNLPFTIDFKSRIQANDLPEVTIRGASTLHVHLDQQSARYEGMQITLEADNAAPIKLALDGDVNWQKEPAISTTLESSHFNARQWLNTLAIPLDTASPTAMTRIKFASSIRFQSPTLKASNIQIQLDETAISGTATVQLPDTDAKNPITSINTQWDIDSLNLDNYLPPPEEETQATNTDATEPTPLALESLKAYRGKTTLRIQQLIANQQTLSNIHIEPNLNKGLVDIDPMSFNIYEGNFNGKMQLDARSPTAKLKFSANANAINIGNALKSLAENENLDGTVDTVLSGTSKGTTDQDIIDNLAATAEITSKEIKIIPINIEQQYCRAIGLLNSGDILAEFSKKTDEAQAIWNTFSQLKPVKIQATYEDSALKLESLSASLEELTANASGSFNTVTGKFDFPFSLSLANFAAGKDYCGGIDEKWRKLEIPLRCKGNLESISPTACLPDTQKLKNLAKAAIKEKTQQKVAAEKERAKDKIEQKANKAIDKYISKEKKEEIKDTYKNLLKGLRGG